MHDVQFCSARVHPLLLAKWSWRTCIVSLSEVTAKPSFKGTGKTGIVESLPTWLLLSEPLHDEHQLTISTAEADRALTFHHSGKFTEGLPGRVGIASI